MNRIFEIHTNSLSLTLWWKEFNRIGRFQNPWQLLPVLLTPTVSLCMERTANSSVSFQQQILMFPERLCQGCCSWDWKRHPSIRERLLQSWWWRLCLQPWESCQLPSRRCVLKIVTSAWCGQTQSLGGHTWRLKIKQFLFNDSTHLPRHAGRVVTADGCIDSR